MKYYVYLLKDGDQAFYVGKGTGKRMYQHAAEARRGVRSPCLDKIRKLEREGRRIVYDKVLVTGDQEDAYRKEIELIAQLGLENLTNLTHGGEGARRRTTSAAHREKISRRIKELYASGALIAPGRSMSAEAWEARNRQVSAKLKGRPRGSDSFETRRRKSEAQRALWASGRRSHGAEAREQQREAGRRGGSARSQVMA